MSLRYTRPMSDVIHVHADSQFELTRTFVRLQEYYESPYDTIRGRSGFSLDMLAHAYTSNGKPFDYFSKWNGMNVPGNIVRKFLGEFPDLSVDECKLNALLYRAQEQGVNPRHYYLIGTWKDEDVTHELAHALYYLDPMYQQAMLELIKDLQHEYVHVWESLTDWLLNERGYSTTVLDDEVQAYLATSDYKYLIDKLGFGNGSECYEKGSVFREKFREIAKMEPI